MSNFHARDDDELLILAFRSMRHDLVDIGASYWFWRYAFDWNQSSEALVWGRAGNRSPVYEALRILCLHEVKASREGKQAITIPARGIIIGVVTPQVLERVTEKHAEATTAR
jgi:hypothetical protein